MTFAIVGGGQLDTGYTIDNSLRFNDGDSPYLSRTPASASNRKTWTWSSWVKRGAIADGGVFGIGTSGSYYFNIRFQPDYISVVSETPSNVLTLRTNALYRDPSAWYHIMFALDTTQGTDSNRAKLYINGEQVTSFFSTTYPSLNSDLIVNSVTPHYLGALGNDTTINLDGYMAETHLIDGQALSPTSFGEFDEDSGIWKPIRYSGSYGTNGFYLDFENSGSLGADQSGNGNNFTPTNLASTDQTTDTPTNNFATMNPLRMSTTDYLSGGATQGTFSEGNLKVLGAAGGTGSAGYMNESATFTMDKFYAELRIEDNNGSQVGVMDETYFGGTFGALNGSGTICISGSNISRNNSNVYTGLSYSAGDVIGVAMNHTSEKVWFSINGVWQGSGTQNPATGDGGYSTSGVGTNMFFAIGDGGNLASGGIANFGQEGSFAGNKTAQGNADGNGYGDFYYAPPSGYLALCTQNLATELSPTIDDGSQYFNTVLWTGTGSGQSITGMGFQPDWLWFKQRNGTSDHALIDSSRGVNQGLVSNSTAAEVTSGASNDLVSFDSDGFTTGTPQNFGSLGNSGATIVTWGWSANAGSTSSNTDGSITSTVQANTTAGFSIVTYTGNSTNGATVGHGLGVSPNLIIYKNRDDVFNWYVHSTELTDKDYFLILNGTSAEATAGGFAGYTWDSSVITFPSTGYYGAFNLSGDNYVAYCFADIEGYSKFGKYTGNGSTDGTFVYTGFRPAWIMWKRDANAGWHIQDNKRNTFNVADKLLYANASVAENTQSTLDFLSNGFKIRTSQSDTNTSGDTFIYMAFAEHPFVSSTAIPVTAR